MIRNVIDNPISTSTEYFLLYKTFSNLNINQGLREINGKKNHVEVKSKLKNYWLFLLSNVLMYIIDVKDDVTDRCH